VWIEPEDVLDCVRQEAARLDWRSARVYEAASPRRVKNAGWLAHDLIAAHLELHRRTGRGARTGKRQHAAEVRRLLEATTDADLQLAQCLILAAIGMLPPDAPRREG
jgi:hypothetical protein